MYLKSFIFQRKKGTFTEYKRKDNRVDLSNEYEDSRVEFPNFEVDELDRFVYSLAQKAIFKERKFMNLHLYDSLIYIIQNVWIRKSHEALIQ